MRWLLTSIFLLLGTVQASAQAIDDAGQWNAWLTQGSFEELGWENKKLKWWFDGHVRLLDDTDGFNQSIVRPGIGWQLNEQSTVWAGYGWISSRALSGLEFDEHRIWQQGEKKVEQKKSRWLLLLLLLGSPSVAAASCSMMRAMSSSFLPGCRPGGG